MPLSNSQFYARGNPFAPPADPHGPFGSVPKDVPMPNPFGDLSKIYPGLAGANTAVSRNIGSQLAGQLSPATQAAIQDASAQFGVSSGMPGSGLQRNRTARDLGLATEAIQDQGLKNYLAAIGQIAGTQTVNPALQTEINTMNTLNRAAPDPTAAAMYSKSLFDQYLANLRGPGGGTRSFGFPGAAPAPTSTSSGFGGFPAPPTATGGSTSMTPQRAGFEVPENWDMFTPEQQWNYPDQLDWADMFGNYYE